MKLLSSFITALVAVAALLLTLPGIARADMVSSTTAAPNPSGYATCTGTNPNGSTATWTVGGTIYFTSEYQNPPTHVYPNGYHNIHPRLTGSSCQMQVTTSGNVQSGCAPISGSLIIYYTAYSGGSGNQAIYDYNLPNPTANNSYNLNNLPISFTEIADVINAQYKVTSKQAGPFILVTVATPYL